MIELIKARIIKLELAFILLALLLLNISNFMPVLQGEKQTPNTIVFPPPTTSGPNDFISVWNTSIINGDSSLSNQVSLPLEEVGGNYNFKVFWGDGSNDTITEYDDPAITHNYTSEGVYTIIINGTLIGWNFNLEGDDLKILEVQQWGCLQLVNL